MTGLRRAQLLFLALAGFIVCLALPLLSGSSVRAANKKVQPKVTFQIVQRQLRPMIESFGGSFSKLAPYAELHFELPKGWYIYWKNPGDSGLPTRVSIDTGPVINARPIEFPVPRRFSLSEEVEVLGYEERLVLRSRLSRLPSPEEALSARASWLLCSSELCIPGDGFYKAHYLPGQEGTQLDNSQRYPRLLEPSYCAPSTGNEFVTVNCKFPSEAFSEGKGKKGDASYFLYSPERLDFDVAEFAENDGGFRLRFSIERKYVDSLGHFTYEVLVNPGEDSQAGYVRGKVVLE